MAESGSSGRPPELSLVYADPQGKPRVFAIPEGTTTLGRAKDNDLVLEDATVTPHHVVLIREGEKLELRDLFSGDTLVNDQKRRNGALTPGDVLSLGQVRLRVMKVAAPKRSTTGVIQRAETERMTRAEPKTQRMLRPTPLKDSQPAPRPDKTASMPRPPADAAETPTSERETAVQPKLDTKSGEARRATGAHTRPTAAQPRITGPQPRQAEPPPAAPAPPGALEELRALQEREARRDKQLARARQLSDEMLLEDDFEKILENIALGFIDIFGADRAVTVLFEEDGRNPLLTVERRRDGTDEGTGVAQEIVDRCLQVRSVIKIAGGHQGLGGLATPLLSKGKAVGLLYFERMTNAGVQPLDAFDVHVMTLLSNQAAVVIAPLVV